ncbi:TetR/AcrR family transcriptional regulator [Micromonospora sp. NPDC005367]|uniref:TetR/AcrR family transcriptional regulator n=1 Tax=Micromonospora sp. NPDC005367 TaxID=3155590 RepID=UPI0033AB927D
MGDEVPVGLARLWRLPTESRLGRPAALDIDRVVRTAVALADRDGLAGVTLAKIAKELDVTSMSLYRYVGSKEELLVLMGDEATGPAPDLPTRSDDWRSGLRAWAYALRAVHARHAWLSHLPTSGPPSGPNAISWMDACLRALRDTELDWGTKVGILTLLSGYVRNAAQLSVDLAEGRRDSGLDQPQVEQEYGRALAGLVDGERFPEVAALFTSGLFEQPPPDDPEQADFDLGLDLIFDGVAAAIRAAGTTNT